MSATISNTTKKSTPVFKVGDLVMCMNTDPIEVDVELTMSSKYLVLDIKRNGLAVVIIDDTGVKNWYWSHRFKKI